MYQINTLYTLNMHNATYQIYFNKNILKPQKQREWKTKIGTKSKCNEEKTVMNMVDINPTMLIITLNINGLKHQLKTEIVREDQKMRSNYIHIYTVYKKPILNIKTHID